MAGIAHAKVKEDAYSGLKPSLTGEQHEAALDLDAPRIGKGEIAQRIGISRQTIYRIKSNPSGAEKAQEAWGFD